MISAIVITKNEEKFIAGCLESLKWADEVIVFDNFSKDKTVEIAKKYTKQVFEGDVANFSDHRNKAAEKAKGDWLLFVDADERVSKELRVEILEKIKQNTLSSFALPRRNIIFGQQVKYAAFSPDYVLRLFKKDQFTGYIGDIHEQPQVKGERGSTDNSLIHFTHRNLDQIVNKSLAWSHVDAKLRFDSNHPPMSGWRFIRILVSELFNQLIKRGGIKGGTVGIIDAILQTFSFVMSYVRLWEMQQPEPLDQKYHNLDQELLENDFTLK